MLACPADRLRVIDGFGMLPACLQAIACSTCPPDRPVLAMVGADGLEPPTLSV